MNFFGKLVTASLALSLLAGCSSSPQEKGPPSDQEFLENVTKALEARWKLTDQTDTSSMSTSDLQKADQQFLDAETDVLGDKDQYEFKDTDLKDLADTYYKGLDLQKEGIQYQGTDDYTNQQKTWQLGYNYRIVAIHDLVEDYEIKVNSQYKATMDDMLAEYEVAKKNVAIQEYVNHLQDTLQYAKDDAKSDEYNTIYTAVIENTTEYTIDSLQIQLDFLDGSDVVLYQGYDSLSQIKPGAKVQSTIYYDVQKGEPAKVNPIITVYTN